MLNELIFLGHIPGTNFYLSLYEIEVVCLVVLLVVLCRKLHAMRRQIADFFLQNPVAGQATRPVHSIGRIGLALPAGTHPAQLDLFAFVIPQDA